MINTKSIPTFKTGISCLVLLQGVSQMSIKAAAPPTEKPNIIIIYADDLDADELNHTVNDIDIWPTFNGVKSLGIDSYNKTFSPLLLTPNIDSLANGGMMFTHFYVNATVCTPSRYSLLTGRYATTGEELLDQYPAGTHATLDWSPAIIRSESLLPKELKKAGYRTGIVGKWHNTPDEANLPVSSSKIEKNSHPSYEEALEEDAFLKNHQQTGVNYLSEGFGWDVVERMEWGNSIVNLDWMCEGALNFIEESKDTSFFLYLSLPVPHGQYQYIYNSLDVLDRRVCANGILPDNYSILPSDSDVYRRIDSAGVPRENAMATHMDDYVGAVMNKLEELGIGENTLIIFTSDHGNRGKNSCYEGGARIPMFIYWPGKIDPGTTNSSLIGNIDISATLLDLVRITPPEDMSRDNLSFLPQLLGDPEPLDWRKSMMIEAGNSKAIVTKEYKYIANRVTPEIAQSMAEQPKVVYWSGVDHHNYNTEFMYKGYWDADQLYDLENDLYEQKNLMGNQGYKDMLIEMKSELASYVSKLPHSFGEFSEGGSVLSAFNAPTNLIALNITPTNLDLKWDASSHDIGLVGYEVYKDDVLETFATGTFVSITGLALDSTYKFKLKALDVTGTYSSESNEVTIKTRYPDEESPSAPSNLIATEITATGCELSWEPSNDNIGVIAYEVYKDGEFLTTTSGTSISISGLESFQTYIFTVKAKDFDGNISTESNRFTIITSDNIPPTAPSNFTVSNITGNSCGLGWSASTDNVGIEEYEIYRDGVLDTIVYFPHVTISGLSNSTTYVFTVKAKDVAGNLSEESSELIVTTLDSVIIGTQKIIVQDGIEIYPNPVGSMLYISNLESGLLSIHSFDGRQVLSADHRPGLAVDVSSLSSGVYILEISANRKNYLLIKSGAE
ncbi:MAG: sulfatase-like hydrolase/transferase [Bacteroidales bacterium]|nr:sulfatase-like hydrolase/transferase [Bacteroidales bacterium]